MRKIPALLTLPLLLIVLTGCGSSRQGAELLKPQIVLYQQPLSRFMLQYPGQISVGFAMEIHNPSGEPIRLRRLELQTVGTGAYLLRRLPMVFNQVIEPNKTQTIPFSSWAWAQGGRLGSLEPVTVRGIAYFESPTGNFQRIFTQHMSQMDNE